MRIGEIVQRRQFDDGLDFVLDSVPTQKKYLNLENGCFGGVKVCLSAPPLQPTASPFAAP